MALTLFVAAACAGEDQGSPAGEVQHTPSGSYYQTTKLPIDPMAKSALAVILAGLTITAFLSIMVARGTREHNAPIAQAALKAHKVNGVIFAALAITIAQYCIRILRVYGHIADPPVGLHVMTAIPIVLLPLMKIAISSRYRGWESLLPAMGITVFILTWVTASIIIIYYFIG